MTGWALWTWVSIVVLTVGSSAVFVWFLFDLLRLRREILGEEAGEADGGVAADR
jgi:hypothetical protein